ncbi:MAG TPA: hypothetical protein VGI20_05525 [Rhizomicrobium sp.]|jgi:hypothetical protein
MMPRKPMGEDFGLDMPFNEAMERFIDVDPREVQANIDRSKKKKPPGGKKKKRAPPGKKAKDVISLRERRTTLARRRGLA